jgi:hypothetical protein
METKEILENNKLIAKYMNLLPEKNMENTLTPYLINGTYTNSRYNFCWNWLIPVVEKINNICDNKSRELSNNVRKQLTALHPFEDSECWQSWSSYTITLTTDISKVYQQVIKFINWYNKHNNGN